MSVKRPSSPRQNKKRKTYLRMFKSFVAMILAIIIVLIVLQFLGVNVSSMLAGVGIASIIIGFALQDALKDIIRGVEIVTDNYYEIGDYIKFGDNEGEVLSIGLRTTRLRDMNSMNVVSIANRNIDKVEIISNYIYLAVPFPLTIKPRAAEEVGQEIVREIQKIKTVEFAELQGLTEITTSLLSYQIVINCEPENKLVTERAAREKIVEVFASHRLRLPRTALDIRTK